MAPPSTNSHHELEPENIPPASNKQDEFSNIAVETNQWMKNYDQQHVINEENEKKEKKKKFEILEEENKIIYREQMGFDENESFQKKLNEITKKVAKAAGMEDQIECLAPRSDEANAFVFRINKEDEKYDENSLATYEEGSEKGRHIYIYTGLVKLLKEQVEMKGKTLTEGHIASLIAHEMQHLVQQKTDPSARPPTRKQKEYDADLEGIEIMGKAGFNPRDCLDVMEIISNLEGKIGYSISHPATSSRIAEISSRISSNDIPLFGLSAEKKTLEELPVSPSRSSEIIHKFSTFLKESENPEKLAEKIRTSDENFFNYLMMKDLSYDAMKYSIYQEVASDPRLAPVLMKYLYIKGVQISKEIERMKTCYERDRDELNQLKQKNQAGPLSFKEKRNMGSLKRIIENYENRTPISTISSFFLQLTRPEDNPWLQEWKKVNPQITTETAKTPASQKQVEHLCDKNLQFEIQYSSDSIDMSTVPIADWEKIAQEWFEKGILSEDIGEKIQYTLSLWPNWRNSNSAPQYEFGVEEDRQKFKIDFFTNILYASIIRYGFVREIDKEMDQQTKEAEEPFKNHVYSLLSSSLSEDDKEIICQFLDLKNKEITISPGHITEVLRILPDLISSPDILLDGNLKHLCSMRVFSEKYIYLILGRLSYKEYEHTQDPEIIENLIRKLSIIIHKELHQFRNLSKDSIPSEHEEKIAWYNDKRKLGATKVELFSIRKKILSESEAGSYIHFLFLINAYQISYDHGKNPMNEKDANTFLEALTADGFSKKLTLDMLEVLYGSISKNEYVLKLKIEAVMIHLGSHISKHSQISAIRNLKEISEKTGQSTDEIMKSSTSMGLYFTSEDLIYLVESNQITLPSLIDHYENYPTVYGYSALDVRKHSYKENILELICIFYTQECDPDIAKKKIEIYKRYGDMTIESMEDNLVTLFIKQKWSLEIIIEKFPTCDVRDKLLYDYWKRENFSDEIFNIILPYFYKKIQYEEFGKYVVGTNILSLKALELVRLKDEQSEKEAEEYYDRLSAEKSLRADNHVFGFYDKIGYLQLLEKKCEKDPQFFVNPERSFGENRSIILDLCPPSEFRDYLLLRALKIELHKMTGRKEFIDPKPFIPMIPHELMKEKLLTYFNTVSFYDDLDMPDPKNFDKAQKIQLIALLRVISKDITSAQSKILIGKTAIEQSHETLAEKKLFTILEFLPEPSPARDDYLNNLLLSNKFSIKKIKEIESLLSHNMVQKGKVSEANLVGLEFVRKELQHFDSKDRMDYLLWLLKIDDLPPQLLRIQGGLLGIHFESLRNNFSLATNAEKKEFLKETLLFRNGLFQPTNTEKEKLMEEFLEKIYESKFAVGSGNSSLFKDIFMTVFKKFQPERRVALFTSLFLALEESQMKGEENLPFHEIAGLFLEQSGGVAIKLGQILSESNEIPFNASHEPMPPEFKKRLSRLKDGVEPFSTIGSVRRLEENQADDRVKYIDGLLSTASIKQAHQIETKEGKKAVLKVRRPAIEHFQHDFEVLETVFDTLKRHGKAVPQYLIEELKAIIDDEKDFKKETENQEKIAKNLSDERHHWKLKIPSIQFSSQDVMIEDFAEGVPLTNIKTTNPKLYGEISRLIGMELLSGICEKGVFHADLHDGNIFVSTDQKTVTFIDAGAVGDTREFKKPVLQLIKGVMFKNPALLAESIMKLSEHGDENISEKTSQLKKQLQTVLQEPITLEQKISKISFEILHIVNPKPALRYLLKALATGAHHFEHLGKNWDISGMKNAREIGKYLLKIWMS